MVSVQHLGLKHQFLLAMPHLEDPHFAGTLSYLCDHDENGTMGVIVNKPLEITLDALFEQIELGGEERPHRHAPVYYGGPTHKEQSYILQLGSSAQWDESNQVDEEVALSQYM